ncbi:hypothetical protein GCM10009544_05530 [Streptomyces stramineus]|uniref:Uncharacterized protein n=1 Tax=Streptomyces stramineus TaxID=173861 RepID=A0ABP3JBZ2_9ACTN
MSRWTSLNPCNSAVSSRLAAEPAVAVDTIVTIANRPSRVPEFLPAVRVRNLTLMNVTMPGGCVKGHACSVDNFR